MNRAIGRVAEVNAHGVRFEGYPAVRLRCGESFVFAVDEHGQQTRIGRHEVYSALDDGCTTWQPVRDITPTACVGDWVIAPAPEPWSPYAP